MIFAISSILVFGQKTYLQSNGLIFREDFKVLATGNYSNIETPYIFVARDKKTYYQLQNLVEGLPKDIDFKKNAVVAGFGGERSSGGWTVDIRKKSARVLVDLKSPGKDTMTTQAITTPFKVSLIPLNEGEELPLDITASYLKNSKTFQVKKGDFEYTGGIAGIRKKFNAVGTIQIITFGDYVTVLFDLKGKGTEQNRKLAEIASGTLKNGNILLSRLDAGSFVENPNPPFMVKGIMKDKQLSLNFEPLSSNIADGFRGKGNLTASLIK